jgi:hypothetical protein
LQVLHSIQHDSNGIYLSVIHNAKPPDQPSLLELALMMIPSSFVKSPVEIEICYQIFVAPPKIFVCSPFLSPVIAFIRKLIPERTMPTSKRQKIDGGSHKLAPAGEPELSPKRKHVAPSTNNSQDDPLLAAYNNPYLAHMIPENGYSPQIAAGRGPLRDFVQRKTTAIQADEAEDREDNPFTLRRHSKTYFEILKKRRELPVHAQRYELFTGIQLIIF